MMMTRDMRCKAVLLHSGPKLASLWPQTKSAKPNLLQPPATFMPSSTHSFEISRPGLARAVMQMAKPAHNRPKLRLDCGSLLEPCLDRTNLQHQACGLRVYFMKIRQHLCILDAQALTPIMQNYRMAMLAFAAVVVNKRPCRS